MKKSFVLAALAVAMSMPLAVSAGAGDVAQGVDSAGSQSVFAQSGSIVVAQQVTWTCEASSVLGTSGTGFGPTRQIAARFAMQYCRMDTPPGYFCFITNCYVN